MHTRRSKLTEDAAESVGTPESNTDDGKAVNVDVIGEESTSDAVEDSTQNHFSLETPEATVSEEASSKNDSSSHHLDLDSASIIATDTVSKIDEEISQTVEGASDSPSLTTSTVEGDASKMEHTLDESVAKPVVCPSEKSVGVEEMTADVLSTENDSSSAALTNAVTESPKNSVQIEESPTTEKPTNIEGTPEKSIDNGKVPLIMAFAHTRRSKLTEDAAESDGTPESNTDDGKAVNVDVISEESTSDAVEDSTQNHFSLETPEATVSEEASSKNDSSSHHLDLDSASIIATDTVSKIDEEISQTVEGASDSPSLTTSTVEGDASKMEHTLDESVAKLVVCSSEKSVAAEEMTADVLSTETDSSSAAGTNAVTESPKNSVQIEESPTTEGDTTNIEGTPEKSIDNGKVNEACVKTTSVVVPESLEKKIHGMTAEERRAQRECITENQAKLKKIGRKFCKERNIPFPNRRNFRDILFDLYRNQKLDAKNLKIKLEQATRRKRNAFAGPMKIKTWATLEEENIGDEVSDTRKEGEQSINTGQREVEAKYKQYRDIGVKYCASEKIKIPYWMSYEEIISELASKQQLNEKELQDALHLYGWLAREEALWNGPRKIKPRWDAKGKIIPSVVKKISEMTKEERIAFFKEFKALRATMKAIAIKHCHTIKAPFPPIKQFNIICRDLFDVGMLDEENIKLEIEADFEEKCDIPLIEKRIKIILRRYCADNGINNMGINRMKNEILPKMPKELLCQKQFWNVMYEEQKTNLFFDKRVNPEAVKKGTPEDSKPSNAASRVQKNGVKAGGLDSQESVVSRSLRGRSKTRWEKNQEQRGKGMNLQAQCDYSQSQPRGQGAMNVPNLFPSAPIFQHAQNCFPERNFSGQNHMIANLISQTNISGAFGGQSFSAAQPAWPNEPLTENRGGYSAGMPKDDYSRNLGFAENCRQLGTGFGSRSQGRDRVSPPPQNTTNWDDLGRGNNELKRVVELLGANRPHPDDILSTLVGKPAVRNSQEQSCRRKDYDDWRWVRGAPPQKKSRFDEDRQPQPSQSVDLQCVVSELQSRFAEDNRMSSDSLNPSSSSRRSWGQASPACKVAIVHEDYPRMEVTDQEAALIRTALLDRIGVQSDVSPRFSNAYQERGALVFECEDQLTVSWLWLNASTIIPWRSAKLRAISWEKPQKEISIYVPKLLDCPTPQVLCYRLMHQNPDLSTESWKLKSNDSSSSEGRNFVFYIDDESIKTLKSLDFRPYLGFSRVTVHVNQE